MNNQRIRNNSALEIMEQTLSKDNDISYIDGSFNFPHLKEIVIDDTSTDGGYANMM